MAGTTLVKHLYVPTSWSDEQYGLTLKSFERSGGDVARVCLADSVIDAAAELEPDSALVVSTIGIFASLDELVAVILALQERRVLLQSMGEPWLNIAIRDYTYCLALLRRALGVIEQKKKET